MTNEELMVFLSILSPIVIPWMIILVDFLEALAIASAMWERDIEAYRKATVSFSNNSNEILEGIYGKV